ncbi:MAG: hypothetical protein ABJ056_18165 [Halioglobus sp.]
MTVTEEHRRILYLQAMDIPIYVSQADCPGALPTTRIAVPTPVIADAARAATTVDASTHGNSAPVGHLTAVLDVASTPKHEPTATAVTTGPSTPAAIPSTTPSTTQAVRFSLVLFRAGRWLWLEETPDGTLASDQVQLVAAMAAALDNKGASAKAKPVTSQFKWPPHNNAQFDLGEEAARVGLEAFLQRHIDESGCSGLIIMGEAAVLRLGESALSVTTITKTLGTRDMIMQPDLKKQVWSDIKSLANGG